MFGSPDLVRGPPGAPASAEAGNYYTGISMGEGNCYCMVNVVAIVSD